MNPEALGGERSLPKKCSPSTAPLVSLLNPSTRGGGRELSARAPGISAPHGKAPTGWGLEVNRGSSEPFSAPRCHAGRGSEVVGWGKSGVDSSCTQTLSARVWMERAPDGHVLIPAQHLNSSQQIPAFQPSFSKFPTFPQEVLCHQYVKAPKSSPSML